MKKIKVEVKNEKEAYRFFCPQCFREVHDVKFDQKQLGGRDKTLTVVCPSCGYITHISCHTEDLEVFGDKQFVYCGQHLCAHSTGWCTVGIDQKVGLGTSDDIEAIKKCRTMKLTLC